MKAKSFSIRTILSVTTGRLLTKSKGPRDNGIGDMYELLGWMTNDEPFTHQLGRFAEECKPWLLRWFPELATANELLPLLDGMKSQDKVYVAGFIEGWLDRVVNECGCKTRYDVPKIPADGHERKDPVQELIEMRGGSEGIVTIKVDQ